MHTPLAEYFHGWHDFFLLVGTAAGTLVGLMFVAASIGATVFKEENRPALEIFLGPTVAHFTAVLVLAILALPPVHTWQTLAGLFAVVSLIGLVYALRVIAQFLRGPFKVELVDWIFYITMPALAYCALLVSSWLLYRESEWGLEAAAVSMIALMLAAIRNAWDMMLFIVFKVPAAPEEKK
jgi:hypothetical protein